MTLTLKQNLNLSESALEAHHAGEIVEVLNLKKQKLEIIPEEIQGFTELIELRLDKNRIEILPDWFGELTHLDDIAL